MKQDYNESDFGPDEVVEVAVGNDFTSYTFNAMKYDYNALIPNFTGSNGLTIDSEIINNSLIDCDHIQRIKKDVELLANDTSKDLNALQSDLNLLQSEIKIIKAITGKEIEKLQKELQEFKKDTNKFLRHLIDTSIILSVAIVFILILIIFYNK